MGDRNREREREGGREREGKNGRIHFHTQTNKWLISQITFKHTTQMIRTTRISQKVDRNADRHTKKRTESILEMNNQAIQM